MQMLGEHIGRSWGGPGPLEKDCPCHKAPCGLVDGFVASCPEHNLQRARTMRSIHRAEDCPALRGHEEARQDDLTTSEVVALDRESIAALDALDALDSPEESG